MNAPEGGGSWRLAVLTTTEMLERTASNVKALAGDENLDAEGWNDLARSIIDVVELTCQREYVDAQAPGAGENDLLAAGELALEGLDECRRIAADQPILAAFALYARPLGFWLGVFAA